VVMPSGDGLVASPAGSPAQGEREPGEADDPGGVAGGQAGQPGGLASQSRRPLIARLQGFRKHSCVARQQKASSCTSRIKRLAP
jgi:hypothetical protein